LVRELLLLIKAPSVDGAAAALTACEGLLQLLMLPICLGVALHAALLVCLMLLLVCLLACWLAGLKVLLAIFTNQPASSTLADTLAAVEKFYCLLKQLPQCLFHACFIIASVTRRDLLPSSCIGGEMEVILENFCLGSVFAVVFEWDTGLNL